MIKVRNTKMVQWSIVNETAVLNLTPTKVIELDATTVFASKYATSWSGYIIIKGKDFTSVSGRVMRQMAKYLEFVKQDNEFDYYRLPFEKFCL